MIRNAHEDETILILGSGESLNDFNVNDLQEWTTIGVNQIARRMDPDYVTLFDTPHHMGEGMLYTMRSLLKSEIVTLTQHAQLWRNLSDTAKNPAMPMAEVDYVPDHPWRQWDEEMYREAIDAWPDAGPPTALPYGPTSCGTAVWLAAFLGAKKVGLIGCDAGGNYFFPSVKPTAYNAFSLGETVHHWERLCIMVKKLFGMDVVNLSKRSLIESIPYQDFRTL